MKYGKKIRWYHRTWSAVMGVLSWFKNKVTGSLLEERISDERSPERNEAQEAVNKVVRETDTVPDCVSALVQNGGACIQVKTDGEWERFVHKSFDLAADEAIKWLLQQGEFVEQSAVSSMNRGQRRAFDATRRLKRGGKAKRRRRE